jgi:cytochrome c556
MADINMINEGIYTQNFQLIEQGAAAINQHPPLSDETRKFIQKTLDDQMPAFGQYDKLVHNHADSIKKAASQHDMNKVLEQYRIVQQGCVSCHTSFRETIIQARTAK